MPTGNLLVKGDKMSVILRSVKVGWLLLSKKGSRFRMILAGTLALLAFITPMMFGIYLPYAFKYLAESAVGGFNVFLGKLFMAEVTIEFSEVGLEVATYVLTVLVGAVVTLPAYAWFFTYCWNTYSRARYGFVDREGTSGGYNYFRALFSGMIMLSRPMLCFVILQFGYLLARLISDASEYDGIALPMIALLIPFWAVGILLSVLFMWVTNSRFLEPYYYGRGMSVLEAKKKSREKCARHPFYCDLFSIIFGVMSVLSLLTVGVLFVLMILPLMMFTYFTLAEYMDGNKLLED